MSPVAKYWDGAAWQELAGGARPSLVTSLPGSPIDGDEVYYLADATAGVVWHLRYRAASASTYKWEFIGGPSLRGEVATQQIGGSNTFADLATVGPDVTVPLAGDYDVRLEAGIQTPAGSGVSALMSFAVGATAATDADAVYIANLQATATAEGSLASTVRKTIPAAATLLRCKYRVTAINAYWQRRRIVVTPVRLG